MRSDSVHAPNACEDLLPRFEKQGFLSLECVLESGLLEVVQQRGSSLRRSDLESLGLKMKQWKNVERTLVQLKDLGARAMPPLVLTDDMTPAERSHTAERLAALLPQVTQTLRSQSLVNSASPLQSPPPNTLGQATSSGRQRIPTPGSVSLTTLVSPEVPRSVLTATPGTSPESSTPDQRVKNLLPSSRYVCCSDASSVQARDSCMPLAFFCCV